MGDLDHHMDCLDHPMDEDYVYEPRSSDYFQEPVVCHLSILYILWNRITGKGYGGQTIQWDVRMNTHEKMRDGCTHLNNSIAKHGWENFKPVIVEQGWYTQAERNEKEIALIAKHGFHGKAGYNLTDGGGGTSGHTWKLTEEQRAAVSGENNPMFGRTGEANPMFGKTQSADHIANKSGENNWQYGMTHEDHPLTGRTQSKEAVAKSAAGHRKRLRARRRGTEEWTHSAKGAKAMSELLNITVSQVKKILSRNSPNRNYEIEKY